MNGCLICGNPVTVKSHLMPRSLILDMKGDDSKLYEGNKDVEGVTYRQNGYWDSDILCAQHEKESGWGDSYSIMFIRSFYSKAMLSRTGNLWEIDNPEPNKLLHFVYSIVWKHAVSKHGARFNMKLGRYEEILRDSIFNQAGFTQQLVMSDPNLTLKGEVVRDIAMAPYRKKMRSWNTWHFIIGGLEFHLKLDQRKFPKVWSPYLVNGNQKLIASRSNAKDNRDIRIFDKIFANIIQTRLD